MSHPGCKKAPTCKTLCDNVEIFSKDHKRVFVKYNVDDVMWEGGTTKALKKPLGNSCGCYQIINNTVNYYQTLFNIALILEQASNYDNFLREQINNENVTWMK